MLTSSTESCESDKVVPAVASGGTETCDEKESQSKAVERQRKAAEEQRKKAEKAALSGDRMGRFIH